MNHIVPGLLSLTCIASLTLTAHAGPFSERSNDPTNPHDPPVAADDSRIVNWATAVVDYSPAPGIFPSFGLPPNDNPAQALGPATDGGTVSLGDLYSTAAPPPTGELVDFGPPTPFAGDANDLTDDYGFIGIDEPGSITLGVSIPITDGPGDDFVIFENSFASTVIGSNYVFAELAYVEVSSNGVDFVRFPSTSNNCESGCGSPLDLEFGTRDFASLDPTEVHNLAGKHESGWGTPFDLADLPAPDTGVDSALLADDINFIRVVDIPGNGSSLDSLGNPIYDLWVSVGTGGFDLNAIGVINQIPEPATLTSALLFLGLTTARARRPH